MLTIEDAYKILKKRQDCSGKKVVGITDIGYGFAFNLVMNDDEVIPGDCPIVVWKNDGKVNHLTIPPLENLDLLEAGEEIAVPEYMKKIF